MKSPPAGELGRFLVAGLSAVGVDFAVYFLLAQYAALPLAVCKTLSFCSGALVSFVLNRIFTFRARHGSTAQQVILFTLLYGVTLGLNVAVNAAALALGVWQSLAWLLATGASTVANFVGMKFVVFAAKTRAVE